MAFVTDIENAFLSRLNTYLDPLEVIPDYDGGPEPTGDYGVLGISVFNKIHRDSTHFYSTSPTTFEEKLKQNYEVVMTVRFYGDSCYDNAFQSQAWLQSLSTQEDFFYNDDISIIDVTNIRRIPELRDTGYIQKASFDINTLIGFEMITDPDADYFDTVIFDSQYENVAGDEVYSNTNTVSQP